MWLVTCNRGWAPFDLLTPERIRVEVKASAYIQSWNQKKLSTPSFSIRRAHAWDPESNAFSPGPGRYSDVYVFCLHHHQDQSTIDPLNLDQWTFLNAATSLIGQLGDQKTAGHRYNYGISYIPASYRYVYSTTRVVFR